MHSMACAGEVTVQGGLYLGVTATAAQLRSAAALGWGGAWHTLTTLWLRGMSDDFTVGVGRSAASLETQPAR